MDTVIQEPEVAYTSGQKPPPIMVDVTDACPSNLPEVHFRYSRCKKAASWVRMSCCEDPKKLKKQGHSREITFDYRRSNGSVRDHTRDSGFKTWAKLLGHTPQQLHELILAKEPGGLVK